jgi:hypothetical protein
MLGNGRPTRGNNGRPPCRPSTRHPTAIVKTQPLHPPSHPRRPHHATHSLTFPLHYTRCALQPRRAIRGGGDGFAAAGSGGDGGG